MFQGISIPESPLAGRLKHFLGTWKKLTRDKNILDRVEGYNSIQNKASPSKSAKLDSNK
jgi:hypothetical protein